MFSLASVISAIVVFSYGTFDTITKHNQAKSEERFYARCNKLLETYHNGCIFLTNSEAHQILNSACMILPYGSCSYNDAQKILEFLEDQSFVYRRPSNKYRFFWNKKRKNS